MSEIKKYCARCNTELTSDTGCCPSVIDSKLVCYECYEKELPRNLTDETIFRLKQQLAEKENEIEEFKEYTKNLNDKLLNLQLFLKELRDSFHECDEIYKEIDRKLKEIGEVE